MADYTPVNANDAAITLTAGAAITGGLLVTVSADKTVIHTSAAGNRAVGVAAHDAPSGGPVTVYLLPGFVHELTPQTPATALTAGVACICGTTSGRVDTTTLATAAAAGTLFGIVVRATAGTSVVRVLGL